MSTAPTIHGHLDERFAPVRDAFAANFADHGELGAAVHVLVDGAPVVDLWAGHTTLDRSDEWRADTLVDVYSVGKAFGALLVLDLVDRGRVDLDDPVATHWPGFESGGKEAATVRHLLTHRLGLPAITEPLADDDLFDFERMIDALTRAPAWWEPGSRLCYHTNTFGHLAGGLVWQVTGELPGTRLRRLLPGADVHIGVGDADLPRCADVHWDGPQLGLSHDEILGLEGDQRMVLLSYANPPGYSSMGVVNTTAWRRAQILSTNTHATARGVAAIYEALRSGEVLSDALLDDARRIQATGWCPVLEQDVAFGLGFQPWTEHRPLGRSPGGYGHFGTGGSLGFADPDRGVAFGYVMNHVVPRWQSPRNRALVDAVYDCLG